MGRKQKTALRVWAIVGAIILVGCGKKSEAPQNLKVGEKQVASAPIKADEQHDTQLDSPESGLIGDQIGTSSGSDSIDYNVIPSTGGIKVLDSPEIDNPQTTTPTSNELVTARLDRNPMGWSWYSLMDHHKAKGYADRYNLLITDIELRTTTPLQFSVAMVQRKGKYDRPFWFYVNQSQAQVENKLIQHNGRILDLESYISEGLRRYCVIIIPREDQELANAYQVHFDQTKSQVEQILANTSLRAADLEIHDDKYDLVTIPNSGIHVRDSQVVFHQSSSALSQLMQSTGRQAIDLERAGNGKYHAILTRPTISAPFHWYTGVKLEDVKAAYKHSDTRIIDLEPYKDGGEIRYTLGLANNSNYAFHTRHADAKAVAEDHIEQKDIVGVAVAIVKNGEVVYQAGFGYSDKSKKFRVSPFHTKFRWASISKSITGALATKMMNAGIVDKDTPISTYWPEYSTPDYWKDHISDTPPSPTTLKLLLSNSAGIQHYSNGPNDMVPQKSLRNDSSVNTGIEWAVRRFKDGPLIKKQGVYSYTTFGFNLAGVALEKGNLLMTGQNKSFHELVEQYIAGPLEMNTLKPHYYWSDVPYLTTGYKRNGEKETDTSDVSYKLPGGGYISNVHDMGKFIKGLVSPWFTSADRQLAWSKHSNQYYGFGMGINCNNCQSIRVSHSGSQPMSNTLMVFYPQKKFGVAIMANTRHGDTDLWTLHSRLKQIFEN